MRLRPFFSYYGSKWRLSPRYDKPLHDTIIEPFAGSACYSLYWHHKNVRLYDKNEVVCSIWKYLINVKEREIRSLPILKPGQAIPMSLPEEARNLMGFWVTKGATQPRRSMTNGPNRGHWSEKIKERIASQLQYIRHWQVRSECYSQLNDDTATWFIDPPYQVGGSHYTERDIDFKQLAKFCRKRRGQVIVCENGDAEWLPFKPFASTKGLKKNSSEVVWTNQGDNQ
tara:strand:+ start:766 stop:1446 length:681 start_codon:yes stop_codon:yes gene_type:complete